CPSAARPPSRRRPGSPAPPSPAIRGARAPPARRPGGLLFLRDSRRLPSRLPRPSFRGHWPLSSGTGRASTGRASLGTSSRRLLSRAVRAFGQEVAGRTIAEKDGGALLVRER